jgi:hypothetical protein
MGCSSNTEGASIMGGSLVEIFDQPVSCYEYENQEMPFQNFDKLQNTDKPKLFSKLVNLFILFKF